MRSRARSRLLSLSFLAPILAASLSGGGCDGLTCEDVGPCEDTASIRIASATGDAFDDGTYRVEISSGTMESICTFTIDTSGAPPVVRNASCAGDRPRNANLFATSATYSFPPVSLGGQVTVRVSRDSAPLADATAPLAYALVDAGSLNGCPTYSPCQFAQAEVEID